jgi:hypothetical protein
VRAPEGLSEVKDLDNEQTGTETRKCGPVKPGKEIGGWQIMIMISPMVVHAESGVGLRQLVTEPG